MRMSYLARTATTAAVLAALAGPASALNLPFGLGGSSQAETQPRSEPPVRYAQAGDPIQRINQLEEDNRALTGRVEELSFQLLQMQEQLRKIQEDNEFRFQELEGKATGANTDGKRTEAAPPRSGDTPSVAASTRPPAGAPAGNATPPGAPGGDQIGDLLGEGGLDTSGLGSGGLGSGGLTPPATRPAGASSGSATVASVNPASAGELYDLGYNYMLAGDYQLAENSFRQYSQTYPTAADVPDAEYWLGESLFQQAKYTDAAETFLKAQKQYPKSPKAPEMLLKLGMSLAKLDNRETACVTFKEVTKRYPQMSANVKKKLQAESAATSC